MSTTKRGFEEVDPDYASNGEQQKKRQRELEQDAKQTTCRRILNIVRNEFFKEISDREAELHLVDRRLNEARLMMDRLRACIVSNYYGQIKQPSFSETSSVHGAPSSIHPALKKYLGKKPTNYEAVGDPGRPQSSNTFRSEPPVSFVKSGMSMSEDPAQENGVTGSWNKESLKLEERTQTHSALMSGSCASFRGSALPAAETSYDDRRSRFKIKKKIIIGNVSKYIPVDHREANDLSSHKWMVYVRGPKSDPDISGYVRKVWFFLHHSYKPNDLVEISSPPFHLTRRGWGEFPVRVQLHFVDPRNKKVDIIHQLKLDKTFSGLQTLGAETVVELDLEKDFFESDNCSNSNSSVIPGCSQSLPNQLIRPSMPKLKEELRGSIKLGCNKSVKLFSSGESAKEQSSKELPMNEGLVDESYSSKLSKNESLVNESSDTHLIDVSSTCNGNSMQVNVDDVIDVQYWNIDGKLMGYPDSGLQHYQDYNIAIEHDGDGGNGVLGNGERGEAGETQEMSCWPNVGVGVGEESGLDVAVATETEITTAEFEQAQSSLTVLLSTADIPEAVIPPNTLLQTQSSTAPVQTVHLPSNTLVKTQSLLPVPVPAADIPEAVVQSNILAQTQSSVTVPVSVLAVPPNTLVQSLSTAPVPMNHLPSNTLVQAQLSSVLIPTAKVQTTEQPNMLEQLSRPITAPTSKIQSSIPINTLKVIVKPKLVNTEHSHALDENSSAKILSQTQRSSSQHRTHPDTPNLLKINSAQVLHVTEFGLAQKCAKETESSSIVSSDVSKNINGCVLKKPSAPQTNATKQILSVVSASSPASLTSSSFSSSDTVKILRTNVASFGETKHKVTVSSQDLLTGEACMSAQETTLSHEVQAALPHQNQSSIQSSEKVIILEPGCVSSQSIVSSTEAEKRSLLQPGSSRSLLQPSRSRSLLQSKQTGPRQVSLLTGKVFVPQTLSSAAVQASLLTHKLIESVQKSKSTFREQTSDHMLALNKPANQVTADSTTTNHITSDFKLANHVTSVSKATSHLSLDSKSAKQVLILKSANHSLLPGSLQTFVPVSQSQSATGKLLSPQFLNVSVVSTAASVPSKTKQVSLIRHPSPLHEQNIQPQTGASLSNIILQVLDQGQSLPETPFPKMSAIGMTKHGKNHISAPRLSTDSKLTTDEDRKRSQYEVLMAWKRNRHLQEEANEKAKKIMRLQKDTIDGEVDVVPELNVDDYSSMGSLLKAAVRLHPLVQAGVNKLTHPYCAESLQQWNTWTLGKQLASEWHRACFVLRYLKSLLRKSATFRDERLMTTRQLMQWCRRHAFSPRIAVSSAAKIKQEAAAEDDNMNSQCSSHHLSSLTSSEALDGEITDGHVSSSVDGTVSEVKDIDVVHTSDESIFQHRHCRDSDVDGISIGLEWLPPSEGAVYVNDELRKRGIKLHPVELEPGVMSSTPANMIYSVMQEFCADVLRESLAVSKLQTSQSSSFEITREDVHAALTQLPEAGFSCSRFLGKGGVGGDGSGR